MSRIFDIVQSMSGQKNVVVLPRPYLDFFRGEQQAHALAAVLNNLVFWSAHGDEDGWFYKTYEELGEEAGGLSKDQTERLVKKLVRTHLSNAISMRVKKVNGTPTTHYKINGDELISRIFKGFSETAKSRKPNREAAKSKPRSCEIENVESRNLGNREVAESFLYTDFKTDYDLQTNKPSCPVAAQPDAESAFKSSHPEAVIFSAKKRQWASQEDLRCAEWIWSRISKLYEEAAESDGEVVKPKEPNWTDWANEVRLMRSQDGRNHRQICELFGRANRDAFWCRNILSPSKLRKKWDELSLKLSQSATPRSITDIPETYSEPVGFRTE